MTKQIDAEKFESWIDLEIEKNKKTLEGRLHPRSRNKIQGVVYGLNLVKETLHLFYSLDSIEVRK